jgi:hypothetical protein
LQGIPLQTYFDFDNIEKGLPGAGIGINEFRMEKLNSRAIQNRDF